MGANDARGQCIYQDDAIMADGKVKLFCQLSPLSETLLSIVLSHLPL